MDAVQDALMRLTPPAFENRRNFRNGALEWSEYRFGDLALESCKEQDAGALLLIVSTPDPTATSRGLEKYSARWDKALHKAFGRSVKFVLCSNEQSEPESVGSLGTETRTGGQIWELPHHPPAE